jgi:hypothetical protein
MGEGALLSREALQQDLGLREVETTGQGSTDLVSPSMSSLN